MTDKQQIEEMTIAEMVASYLDCNNIKVSNQLLPLHIEDIILKAGYHKVPKNAVVLTDEKLELGEWKGEVQVMNMARQTYDACLKQVRKETAKEILKWLVNTGVINTAPNTTKMYFKEQFGVEVEE